MKIQSKSLFEINESRQRTINLSISSFSKLIFQRSNHTCRKYFIYQSSDKFYRSLFLIEKFRLLLNEMNLINSNDDNLAIKLKKIHDYISKQKQVKIIRYILDERDVIFFVKINYDKNVIFYLLSTLKFDNIILLMMSLNVLKTNQKIVIQKMNANVNFCVLNNEISFDKFLREIEHNIYIYILINFELALFNVFMRRIL